MSELDEAPETELPDSDEQTDIPPSDHPEGDSRDGEASSTTDERVKSAQRKMHEATARAAKLERDLAEIKGKMDAVIQMQQPKQEETPSPLAFLDSPEFIESLYDDPKNAQKALKQIVNIFGETIRAQDEVFNKRLSERTNSLDPEFRAVKDKVAQLRKNPKLADLPDEYLVEMAKEISKSKPVEGDGYRGSLPSGGRPTSKDKNNDEEGIAFMMKRLGYDRYESEK